MTKSSYDLMPCMPLSNSAACMTQKKERKPAPSRPNTVTPKKWFTLDKLKRLPASTNQTSKTAHTVTF